MAPWRRLTSVFHPTDLSAESEIAFLHALRLALSLSAELRLMHVAESRERASWAEFPQVRATLAAWGLLPPDAAREDVLKLGIDVEKILVIEEAPKDAILAQLESRPPTLMVLATYQLSGLARLVSTTIAESVARESGVPTLFIPAGHQGFVSPLNGIVNLTHILIPINHTPDPQMAVDAAASLADILQLNTVAFRLLYVGEQTDVPHVHLPLNAQWSWQQTAVQGDVVDTIVNATAAQQTDLLLMVTEGHVGLVDALFGSTTEQVLRHVPCPVLAIPADAKVEGGVGQGQKTSRPVVVVEEPQPLPTPPLLPGTQ